MKNKIMTLVLFLLTNVAQRFAVHQGDYKEIAQLKLSLLYLKIIKTSRLLFITSLGIGVSLIFLLTSLVLFHATFFIYAPCSMETKMWVGFISAAVYLCIAAFVFTWVFAEEKWLKIFNAQKMLNEPDVVPEQAV